MVTYTHIGYSMENAHGFKFKTNYKPTIMNFLRHVLDPEVTEVKGAEVEIPECKICKKSFREFISQNPEAEKSE